MSLLLFEAKKQIGSASMHAAAANNLILILTDLSSFFRQAETAKRVSRAELYQEIAESFFIRFHTQQEIDDCLMKLASAADQAYTFRDLDTVASVGRVLIDIPRTRHLGSYYLALALNQGGRGDVTRAGSLFEQVASRGSLQYRARAMLALRSNCLASSDLRGAISFYRNVTRIATSDAAFDPFTAYFASQMSAVVKSIDVDNPGALVDLEKMAPLARAASLVQPYPYYSYL